MHHCMTYSLSDECAHSSLIGTFWHFISGYMMIMGTKKINGLYAYLTSPKYDTSKTYCLSFEYEVVSEETSSGTLQSPALNVYSRCQPNLFAGAEIWAASKISRGVVEITVLATKRAVDCYIDFVGRLHDVETDKVALANVLLNEGMCHDPESVVCQDGDFMCENDLTCGSASSRCDNTGNCQINEQKLLCGETCHVFFLLREIREWMKSCIHSFIMGVLHTPYFQNPFLLHNSLG